MTRTPEPDSLRRGRAAGALTLFGAILTTVLVGVASSAAVVSAAPNPYRGGEAAHTVTIASNGSYRVHIDQSMELARDYDFTFGGMVHDGFRLPDTESVLPPYLRAQYSDPAISMDGEPAEVAATHNVHAVEITAEDHFTEGEHEATVDYTVTGAAVGPTQTQTDSKEVSVYFRPLVPGDVTVRSAEPIDAAVCEDWPPDGEDCGHRSGEDWVIGSEELEEAEAIRIILDADEADLLDPQIDSTN